MFRKKNKLSKKERLEDKLKFYQKQYKKGLDLYTSDWRPSYTTERGLNMMYRYNKKIIKVKEKIKMLEEKENEKNS